jgi:hypothetical protein
LVSQGKNRKQGDTKIAKKLLVFSNKIFINEKVIDSWEDISAADAPQLPKSAIKVEKVETPPEKIDTETTKKHESLEKAEHQRKKADKKNPKNTAKAERTTDSSVVDQMGKLSIASDQSK